LPSSGEFPDVDDFYINKYSEYNVLLPYTSTVLYETPGKHIPTTALFLDTRCTVGVTKDESGNRLCFGIQYSDLTNCEATLYPLRPYLNLTHNTDTQRFFPCALRICPLIHMFKKCHFRVSACVVTQLCSHITRKPPFRVIGEQSCVSTQVPFCTLGVLFRDSSVTEMCVSVKMSVVRAVIFSLQLLALSLSPSIRQTNAKQQSLLSCQLLEMFRCLVYLNLPSIRQCPPVGLRDRR
jgi:hypothetical protein